MQSINGKTILICWAIVGLLVLLIFEFSWKPIIYVFAVLMVWFELGGPRTTLSGVAKRRHPEFLRAIQSKTGQKVLFRPFWTRGISSREALTICATAQLLFGALLYWLTYSSYLNWKTALEIWVLVPTISIGAAGILETLLIQSISMPFVGNFVNIILLVVPSYLVNQNYSDHFINAFPLLPTILTLIWITTTLWFVDLLRTIWPTSNRNRKLRSA